MVLCVCMRECLFIFNGVCLFRLAICKLFFGVFLDSASLQVLFWNGFRVNEFPQDTVKS